MLELIYIGYIDYLSRALYGRAWGPFLRCRHGGCKGWSREVGRHSARGV